MAIQLTTEQQAAVDNRGGELLVSAAAGSGKTKILVERLLNRVEQEKIDLDRFLVITYTKAAASELRGKILTELNSRLEQDPEGHRFLRRQRTILYRTQISTIHSFCTALLREDGYRIGLDSDFRVADDSETVPIRDAVLSRLLEDKYESMESHPDFEILVDTLSQGRDDKKLKDIVLDIYTHVQSHPDPEKWLKEKAEDFQVPEGTDAAQTKWGKVLLDETRTELEYWKEKMNWLLERLREDEGLERAYSESYSASLAGLELFLDAVSADTPCWEQIRSASVVEFPKLRPAPKDSDQTLKKELGVIRDRCKNRITDLKKYFDEPEEALLDELRSVYPVIRSLHELVIAFSRAFSAEKRRRGLVDFSDLEHLAILVLYDENGGPTEAAKRWSDRFTEVMVDEYQDTNAVQNKIFDAVSDGRKRLFQVGDIKQSIYRFRLADPNIFNGKLMAFPFCGAAEDGGPRKVVMSYNFRSRRSVLNGTNFVFEAIMSRAFGEIDYNEEHRLNFGMTAYPENPQDHVELDVLDLSEKVTGEEQADIHRDEFEADYIAQRIRQLVHSRFQVFDNGRNRDIRYEDIAILHRSPSGIMRRLTEALDRYNIPWNTDTAGDFFAQPEIVTAISYLEVIDNPRQDIPLLAVMCSPIYSFSGDDLALLRSDCKDGDIYTCLLQGAERGNAKCMVFVSELNRLRTLSADMSGSRLLQLMYEMTGLVTVFSAMDGGTMRQTNLNLLYEYACQMENGGHRGVFGLVNQLRRIREAGLRPLSMAKESLGGVQIMSIHKSKGLEFPVVILAGLSRQFNKTDLNQTVLFHSELGVGPSGVDLERDIVYKTLARNAVSVKLDREMKAEEMRLLYVAMTRAREKLILIYTTQDWKKAAGGMASEAGRVPEVEALRMRNCMGDWILLPVLTRPDAEELRSGAEIQCEICPTEDHWDIRLIHLQNPEKAGKTQYDDEEPADTHHLTEQETERLTWKYPFAALAAVPSKVTATQMKGRKLDEEIAEYTTVRHPITEFRMPRFEQGSRRLLPTQIGTAMHTVMQLIDLTHVSTIEDVQAEIRRLTEKECLTPQMAEVVDAEKVHAFFASPVGKNALQAADLRREFKFSILEPASILDPELPEEEQVLLQGVVDCCFTGPDGFTVVDFKSDRVRPGSEESYSERYRGQITAYANALRNIFGVEVKHRVLWYFETGTAVAL